MKINGVYGTDKILTVEDIDMGEVFFFEGKDYDGLFLMTNESACVDLETGEFYEFRYNEIMITLPVKRVNAEVNIL